MQTRLRHNMEQQRSQKLGAPSSRQILPQLLLLAVLLLILPGPAACQSTTSGGGHLCDNGNELRSILAEVDLPSCLAESHGGEGGRNCSLMRHFAELASSQGKSLDDIMSRVSVVILAHSDFTKELMVPDNPVLELEPELSRHMAFIGVTKCLRESNSVCQRLRVACFGGFVSHFAFMVSGHCSKSWGCSPIYSTDKNNLITLLNTLPYVAYRLLERQAFVAKERGELQLSASTSTEYFIQTELNDTHGSQLVAKDSMPVVMFVAEPKKSLAYYQQLVWFLDAALILWDLFSFHIVVTPLSQLKVEAERPLYRWNLENHESYLAVYTKRLCSSKPTWVFTCKPLTVKSSQLIFAEQYASFMLHGALKDAALTGPSYPSLTASSEALRAFLRVSTSYVLAVVPVDEILTDPKVNWEVIETLIPYLGSSFGVTYYPIILTKASALQALDGMATGIDLEQAFHRPSLFMRLPNGAFVVLKIDEPIALLDKTVREVSTAGKYQMVQQSMREMLNNQFTEQLPLRMANSGHLIDDASRSDDDMRDVIEEIQVKNRTDAFVEQANFRDIYSVAGVLVVESDPVLMRDFFDKLGQDKPWLVLFTVSWSPLCKAARAVWSSVGQCAKRLGFADVQLVKVDCFEANEICHKLGVTTYPTVSVFSRGVQLSTYSGPIATGDLCLYVKLAFEPPVISTGSEKETRQLLDKLLPLKSRVFILRGPEIPSRLAALAKSLRFREVFVHERTGSGPAQLTAAYHDVRPSVSRFEGSLDDSDGMRSFVENGHLNSVFPCSWAYLPQALRRDRPLAILFHLSTPGENCSFLDQLHGRFSDRVSLCHLNLRNFAHLNDLVGRLAGLSLPALVVLAKPPGSAAKVTYRLPLGALPPMELPVRASDWLELALSFRLTDGRPVEPSEKWQPASQVFNFVDQVYHDKAAPERTGKMHSSRAFTMDSTQQGGEEDGKDEGDKPAGQMESMANAPSGSMRDEL